MERSVIGQNLLKTPTSNGDLVVKFTCSGATVLKDDRQFHRRVNGSRSHVLLPNANLVPWDHIDERGNYQLEKPIKNLPAGKKVTRAKPEPLEGEPVKEPKQYRINKKLIRQRVYAFLLAQKKPVLHAVTVSFPPCVNEDTGYIALNSWLTYCRTYLHLRNYLFVAERQKNGTIHFHILVPQYINIQKANKAMGVTLANMVRSGKLNWNVKAARKYNGVDLSKNRNTKRVTNFALGGSQKALANYITKYVSKNDEGFTHYAWHNSRGFSSMMLSITLTESEAKYLQVRQVLDLQRCRMTEFATFVPWKGAAAPWFNELVKGVQTGCPPYFIHLLCSAIGFGLLFIGCSRCRFGDDVTYK